MPSRPAWPAACSLPGCRQPLPPQHHCRLVGCLAAVAWLRHGRAMARAKWQEGHRLAWDGLKGQEGCIPQQASIAAQCSTAERSCPVQPGCSCPAAGTRTSSCGFVADCLDELLHLPTVRLGRAAGICSSVRAATNVRQGSVAVPRGGAPAKFNKPIQAHVLAGTRPNPSPL